MESTAPAPSQTAPHSPTRPISWTRDDDISKKTIEPHPLYSQHIAHAKVTKGDTYVVIMHAIRYLLKDRSYYSNIPFDKGVIQRTNPWNGGRDVPQTGLMRYGYDGMPGIEQLLGIKKWELRTVSEFMAILDILGEIVLLKHGANTYYHLLEGSPFDRAELPPFETMLAFGRERDDQSINPFRRLANGPQAGRKRARRDKNSVAAMELIEILDDMAAEPADEIKETPFTPSVTAPFDDMAGKDSVEIPDEFKYVPGLPSLPEYGELEFSY